MKTTSMVTIAAALFILGLVATPAVQPVFAADGGFGMRRAFSDFRQQHRQDRLKQRLDKLVSQGKITGDQENAIINEINSLRQKYPINPGDNLTKDQLKQRLQNMMNDFKSWAQSNGLDLSVRRRWLW